MHFLSSKRVGHPQARSFCFLLFAIMPCPSSTLILFLSRIVFSLAAVDLDSGSNPLVLDDASGNSGPDSRSMTSFFNHADINPLLALDTKLSPTDGLNSFTAGATTSPHNVLGNDVRASSVALGTASGSEVANLDNNQTPNGASARCITDTQNARRRARRGCITIPNTQTSSTGKEKDTQVGGTRTSDQQDEYDSELGNGRHDEGEQRTKPTDDELSLPRFKPGLDHRKPTKNYFLCSWFDFFDSNIPMCDSGNRRRDVVDQILGAVEYRILFNAHLCKLILKSLLYLHRAEETFFPGGGGRQNI